MKLFILSSILFVANGQRLDQNIGTDPRLQYPSTVCKYPSMFDPNADVKVDFSSGFEGPCVVLFATSGQFAEIDWTSVTCDSFNKPSQQSIVSQASGCCSDGLTVCS